MHFIRCFVKSHVSERPTRGKGWPPYWGARGFVVEFWPVRGGKGGGGSLNLFCWIFPVLPLLTPCWRGPWPHHPISCEKELRLRCQSDLIRVCFYVDGCFKTDLFVWVKIEKKWTEFETLWLFHLNSHFLIELQFVILCFKWYYLRSHFNLKESEQILIAAALTGHLQPGIIIINILDVVDEELHSVLFSCKNKSLMLVLVSVKFSGPLHHFN